MQKKKKDIYGRTYTKFGYILHIVLVVLGFTSFMMMLGFTGSCEQNYLNCTQYAVRVVPCLAVFGASIFIHNKVFG